MQNYAKKKWLVATAKTILDAVKASAENLVHKRAKEARELIKKYMKNLWNQNHSLKKIREMLKK